MATGASDSNTVIQILIEARDEASARLQGVGKAIDSVGRTAAEANNQVARLLSTVTQIGEQGVSAAQRLGSVMQSVKQAVTYEVGGVSLFSYIQEQAADALQGTQQLNSLMSDLGGFSGQALKGLFDFDVKAQSQALQRLNKLYKQSQVAGLKLDEQRLAINERIGEEIRNINRSQALTPQEKQKYIAQLKAIRSNGKAARGEIEKNRQEELKLVRDVQNARTEADRQTARQRLQTFRQDSQRRNVVTAPGMGRDTSPTGRLVGEIRDRQNEIFFEQQRITQAQRRLTKQRLTQLQIEQKIGDDFASSIRPRLEGFFNTYQDLAKQGAVDLAVGTVRAGFGRIGRPTENVERLRPFIEQGLESFGREILGSIGRGSVINRLPQPLLRFVNQNPNLRQGLDTTIRGAATVASRSGLLNEQRQAQAEILAGDNPVTLIDRGIDRVATFLEKRFLQVDNLVTKEASQIGAEVSQRLAKAVGKQVNESRKQLSDTQRELDDGLVAANQFITQLSQRLVQIPGLTAGIRSQTPLGAAGIEEVGFGDDAIAKQLEIVLRAFKRRNLEKVLNLPQLLQEQFLPAQFQPVLQAARATIPQLDQVLTGIETSWRKGVRRSIKEIDTLSLPQGQAIRERLKGLRSIDSEEAGRASELVQNISNTQQQLNQARQATPTSEEERKGIQQLVSALEKQLRADQKAFEQNIRTSTQRKAQIRQLEQQQRAFKDEVKNRAERIKGLREEEKQLQNLLRLRNSRRGGQTNRSDDPEVARLREIRQQRRRETESLRGLVQRPSGLNVAQGRVQDLANRIGVPELGQQVIQQMREIDDALANTFTKGFAQLGRSAGEALGKNLFASVGTYIGRIANRMDSALIGVVNTVQSIPQRFTAPLSGVQSGFGALAGMGEPTEIFNEIKQGVGGAVQAISRVGFEITYFQQAVGTLRQVVMNGPFKLLIGQNVELRQQLIATQSSLAATTKVVDAETGAVINNSRTAVKALGPAVEAALAQVRKDSLELVGVTSAQLVEVFQIISTQAGAIAADLSEVGKLTISFAATLGSLGMPLFQARQEINSILQGTIDMNSVIAKTLNITNEQVNKWKAQGTAVEKLLEKMESFKDANALAAQSIGGITSNIQEIIENITLEAGGGLVDPIVDRLRNVFDFLDTNKDAITDVTKVLSEKLFMGLQTLVDSLGKAFLATQGIIGQLPIYLVESMGNALQIFGEAIKTTVEVMEPFINALAALATSIRPLGGVFLKIASLAFTFRTAIGLLTKGFGLFAQIAPVMGEVLFGVKLRLTPMINQFSLLSGMVGRGAAGFLTLGKNLQSIPGAAQQVMATLGPLGPFMVGLIPQISNVGIQMASILDFFPQTRTFLKGILASSPREALVGIAEAIKNVPKVGQPASKFMVALAKNMKDVGGNASISAILTDQLNKVTREATKAMRMAAISTVAWGAALFGLFTAFDKLVLKNQSFINTASDLWQTISDTIRVMMQFKDAVLITTGVLGGFYITLLLISNQMKAVAVISAITMKPIMALTSAFLGISSAFQLVGLTKAALSFKGVALSIARLKKIMLLQRGIIIGTTLQFNAMSTAVIKLKLLKRGLIKVVLSLGKALLTIWPLLLIAAAAVAFFATRMVLLRKETKKTVDKFIERTDIQIARLDLLNEKLQDQLAIQNDLKAQNKTLTEEQLQANRDLRDELGATIKQLENEGKAIDDLLEPKKATFAVREEIKQVEELQKQRRTLEEVDRERMRQGLDEGVAPDTVGTKEARIYETFYNKRRKAEELLKQKQQERLDLEQTGVDKNSVAYQQVVKEIKTAAEKVSIFSLDPSELQKEINRLRLEEEKIIRESSRFVGREEKKRLKEQRAKIKQELEEVENQMSQITTELLDVVDLEGGGIIGQLQVEITRVRNAIASAKGTTESYNAEAQRLIELTQLARRFGQVSRQEAKEEIKQLIGNSKIKREVQMKAFEEVKKLIDEETKLKAEALDLDEKALELARLRNQISGSDLTTAKEDIALQKINDQIDGLREQEQLEISIAASDLQRMKNKIVENEELILSKQKELATMVEQNATLEERLILEREIRELREENAQLGEEVDPDAYKERVKDITRETNQKIKSLELDREILKEKQRIRKIQKEIDDATKAVTNEIKAQVNIIEKQINDLKEQVMVLKEVQMAHNTIEKALDRQAKALDIIKSAQSGMSGLVNARLGLLGKAARTDRQKAKVEQLSALARLQAMKAEFQMQIQSLAIEEQKVKAAHEREMITNRIAQIEADIALNQARVANLNAIADLRKAEAEVQKAIATGESAATIRALQLEVEARREGVRATVMGIEAQQQNIRSVQMQREELIKAYELEQQLIPIRRQTLIMNQEAQFLGGLGDLIDAIPQKGIRNQLIRAVADQQAQSLGFGSFQELQRQGNVLSGQIFNAFRDGSIYSQNSLVPQLQNAFTLPPSMMPGANGVFDRVEKPDIFSPSIRQGLRDLKSGGADALGIGDAIRSAFDMTPEQKRGMGFTPGSPMINMRGRGGMPIIPGAMINYRPFGQRGGGRNNIVPMGNAIPQMPKIPGAMVNFRPFTQNGGGGGQLPFGSPLPNLRGTSGLDEFLMDFDPGLADLKGQVSEQRFREIRNLTLKEAKRQFGPSLRSQFSNNSPMPISFSGSMTSIPSQLDSITKQLEGAGTGNVSYNINIRVNNRSTQAQGGGTSSEIPSLEDVLKQTKQLSYLG